MVDICIGATVMPRVWRVLIVCYVHDRCKRRGIDGVVGDVEEEGRENSSRESGERSIGVKLKRAPIVVKNLSCEDARMWIYSNTNSNSNSKENDTEQSKTTS
jgi:hypothetical protein